MWLSNLYFPKYLFNCSHWLGMVANKERMATMQPPFLLFL